MEARSGRAVAAGSLPRRWDMSTLGIVLVVVLIVAVVVAALQLRGRATGEFGIGPFRFKASGERGSQATVEKSKAGRNIDNAATGDASVRASEAGGDIRNEAGRDPKG